LARSIEEGDYSPPPREECEERERYGPIDDEAAIWLTQHYWHRAGRLVEFALTVSITLEIDGQWREVDVARVDIDHGHAHAHAFQPNGSDGPAIHIHRIDTVDDINVALSASMQALHVLARTLLKGGRDNEQ
jgi:hypothetical protein